MQKTVFPADYELHQKAFEDYLLGLWTSRNGGSNPFLSQFDESISYSLLQPGAKRFRPILSLLTAEMLSYEPNKVLPFATSVEMVHCFSLIHDDLPCMDDDDERRGQPTNHIKYGEAIALLAGDALLAEAFATIVKGYSDEPKLASGLVGLLAEATGRRGMIGGQVIDIKAQANNVAFEELKLMHSLKTGALISVAVEGACLVASASPHQHQALKEFGGHLGLAFQLADDLLDAAEELAADEISFVTCLGEQKTKDYLKDVTDQALERLSIFGDKAKSLEAITRFNHERTY